MLSHLSYKCSVEHVVFNARALSYINKVVKFKGKPDGIPGAATLTSRLGAGLALSGGGSFQQCSFWDRRKGQSGRD